MVNTGFNVEIADSDGLVSLATSTQGIPYLIGQAQLTEPIGIIKVTLESTQRPDRRVGYRIAASIPPSQGRRLGFPLDEEYFPGFSIDGVAQKHQFLRSQAMGSLQVIIVGYNQQTNPKGLDLTHRVLSISELPNEAVVPAIQTFASALEGVVTSVYRMLSTEPPKLTLSLAPSDIVADQISGR